MVILLVRWLLAITIAIPSAIGSWIVTYYLGGLMVDSWVPFPLAVAGIVSTVVFIYTATWFVSVQNPINIKILSFMIGALSIASFLLNIPGFGHIEATIGTCAVAYTIYNTPSLFTFHNKVQIEKHN